MFLSEAVFLLEWVWRVACYPRRKVCSDSVSWLTTGDTDFAPWAFAESLHTRSGVFNVFFVSSNDYFTMTLTVETAPVAGSVVRRR